MRELKWHIVDGNDNPLCWEHDGWESERAIEFESEEEATEFMKMLLLNYPDFRINEAHITKTILFYDGDYVSGARVMKLMKKLNED